MLPGRTAGAAAPSLRGHWLLGHFATMRADPLGTLLEAARRGDVVRMRFLHAELLLLTHPDAVRHVLQDEAKNYTKQTIPYIRSRSLLGRGLFTSDGEHWRRQRRLMQPAFHRQHIAGFARVMAEAAREVAERWAACLEDERPIDVAAEMTRVTMRIVCRTLLGSEVHGDGETISRAIGEASAILSRRLHAVFDWPLWLPTSSNRRYRGARATLDAVVLGMIEARRRAGEAGTDLLGMLLEARDEESGAGMSDVELRDEVMTLFLAGHETTAAALVWTFGLVARHPAVERRLRAELEAVLGERDPGLEDLEHLPYTRMVIEEAMRLYPPVWGMSRRARASDEVGGVPVPAGSVVFLSPYVTHRHPAFWERPEEYVPERFRPELVAARPRFAYFPFLGGPRQCLGSGFAMMEAQLILATLLRRYRLVPPPGQILEPEPHLTLRPRGGLPMWVRRWSNKPLA